MDNGIESKPYVLITKLDPQYRTRFHVAVWPSAYEMATGAKPIVSGYKKTLRGAKLAMSRLEREHGEVTQ